MPAGRPPEFTQEIADNICEWLADGKSLKSFCRQDGSPRASTVFRWLADPRYVSFRDQYAKARDCLADTYFEDAVEIADDGSNDWILNNDPENPGYRLNGEHVQRSRLRVDTRKWAAGRLAPKKYGDKITTELTGKDGGPIETVDLSPLEAARRIAFALAKGEREKG